MWTPPSDTGAGLVGLHWQLLPCCLLHPARMEVYKTGLQGHTTRHAYRLLFLTSLQNHKMACGASHIKGFKARLLSGKLRQVCCKAVTWIFCCKCTPHVCCNTQICCLTVVCFIGCSLNGCLWLMLAQVLGTRRLLLLLLLLWTVRLPAHALLGCEQHMPQYKKPGVETAQRRCQPQNPYVLKPTLTMFTTRRIFIVPCDLLFMSAHIASFQAVSF